MSDTVSGIYDSNYAETYDERFLLSEFSKISSDFELELLSEILSENSRWLDVGCGTGYYLSAFQDIERCGVDTSPAMLKIARSRNANARLVEQDFRVYLNQTNDKWDVVSCMWMPYNYLNSMHEFDEFLDNLTHVVEKSGSLFLPLFDLEDIRPHTVLDYDWYTEMPGYEGNIILTSTTWTWKEKVSGKIHEHLIAPQLGYVLDRLSGLFEQIRVVRYPVYQPDWVSRKAVLCLNRQEKLSQTNIVIDENPSCYKPGSNSDASSQPVGIDKNVSSSELIMELIRRFGQKLNYGK
ncbi:MAG: class I SAM-dependent methyltransferase [Flavobacteriales bacterium]|nr:class I SAM-dependent methyltransferase [Flavobacteriales bacterium]